MRSNKNDGMPGNVEEVLAFLKTRYPMYHRSNVFFRDLQYGIQTMLERQDRRVGYREAEQITRSFIERLVSKNILVPIDQQTWVLHYPEFRKAPVRPASKAAAPAPPAPAARTQGDGAGRSSPVPSGPAGTQSDNTAPGERTAGQ